ncbi:hypothetical protein NMY22_g9413 [Coprinellus aureogranulatus]|nr:hypothetical protein NMY22_g9413 [Coprinellus aureogranulatus]
MSAGVENRTRCFSPLTVVCLIVDIIGQSVASYGAPPTTGTPIFTGTEVSKHTPTVLRQWTALLRQLDRRSSFHGPPVLQVAFQLPPFTTHVVEAGAGGCRGLLAVRAVESYTQAYPVSRWSHLPINRLYCAAEWAFIPSSQNLSVLSPSILQSLQLGSRALPCADSPMFSRVCFPHRLSLLNAMGRGGFWFMNILAGQSAPFTPDRPIYLMKLLFFLECPNEAFTSGRATSKTLTMLCDHPTSVTWLK